MCPKENTPTVIVTFFPEETRIAGDWGILSSYMFTIHYKDSVIRITWVVKNNASNDQWKTSRWDIS